MFAIHFDARALLKSATIGLAISAIAATQAFADDVRFRLAGTLPIEHFGHEILENMVEEIESAGVGLTVQYFPASQLGSGEELFEDVVRGNVDMVHASIYAHRDPRLEVTFLPYLVGTHEELVKVYGDPDSGYNTVMREVMGEFGVIPLGTIAEGLVGVVANKKPSNYATIDDKEMNIRVWSSQLAKDTTEALGFQTTTMNWAEVFPALQAGTIDGAICCTPEWSYSTFAVSDVGKYFIPYNAFTESSMIYGSQKFWDKLDEEQRVVVRNAAMKAANEVIQKAWEINNEAIQKLKDRGWEILELSEDERAAIVAHIRETVWPQVEGKIGKETIERVINN